MIRHIIVQPSIDYYTWQVETLINNLIGIGVNPNYIDIICDSYKTKNWLKLANHYNYVRFFFYEDTRQNPKYISSIRPHLLMKHFTEHPYLENETIFYHDSDIYFTKPYDSALLEATDTWYLSDTRNYIGYEYIKSKGDDVFDAMCSITNIDKQIVIDNEINSGGAQYVMKNINAKYWEDVYDDSENLFINISKLNIEKKKLNPEYHELQIWCADMWAVLWNAWKRGIKTKILKELDFSWATSGVNEWNTKNIYHNAGVTSAGDMFYKGDYINKLPYDSVLSLNKNLCSSAYYDEVMRIGKKSVLRVKNIGIVILATNSYFVLGIRLVKRFMEYYKGNEHIKFYFFSDNNPIDYLPTNIDIEYIHTENTDWVDGTNLKFSSILSLENKFNSDYLFYFDADTNVSNDFTEEWFLGDMVGGQHYGDMGWMKDNKAFDRNPNSMAYVPVDTELKQMYFYGAFFGGTFENMISFCKTMREYQLKDKEINYEPGVNDESYINKYFHYNPPSKIVMCGDFKFDISDKGGIGETRRTDLNVDELKEELLANRDKNINISCGKIITYDTI